MKRTAFMLLALTLLLSAFSTTVVSAADGEAAVVVGDVNGDGKVDNLDAVTVLKYDAGQKVDAFPPLPYPEEPEGLREKINADYLSFKDIDVDSLSNIDKGMVESALSGWHYRGEFSGCSVVSGIWPFEETDDVRCEEIAGYYLYYASDIDVSVYKDGGFYSVKEAYENGMITKEDVFGIGVFSSIATEYLGDPVYRRTAADMDGDYRVTNVDAARILQIDAGL